MEASSTISSRSLDFRDPATQSTLIDCGSLVQGKRSSQALETNSGSRAQNSASFSLVCPTFDWPFCKRWFGLSCCAHTDPQLMHRFGCVQVSKSHRQLGPRPQPGTSATGHRLFASIPRVPSHGVDAKPSAVTSRNEPSFGPRAISACCAPANSTAPGACWRAAAGSIC